MTANRAEQISSAIHGERIWRRVVPGSIETAEPDSVRAPPLPLLRLRGARANGRDLPGCLAEEHQ